jgi:hypothetical protein
MESTRSLPDSRNLLKLALAWGLVGVPLIWGIVQTLVNAIKAFH